MVDTSKHERIEWVLPAYLEPYRGLINNTGGNTVEDLMGSLNNERNLVRTNFVRFTLAVAVQSQVQLLEDLHHAGLLTVPRG